MTFDKFSVRHSDAAPFHADPDDLENNTSGNPSLHDVLAARLHRRHVLKGGVGAMTMAGLGTLGAVGTPAWALAARCRVRAAQSQCSASNRLISH